MDDLRPAGDPEPGASASGPGPPDGAAPPSRSRHRAWQWLSIVAMLVGAFLALGAIGTAAAARQDPSLGIEPRSLIPVLVAGAALLVLGCVLNALRALVVRRWLPANRYRGPSVLLLLLLAAIAAIGAGFFFPNDALVLTTGTGRLTLLGSLVLLTATQISLLIAAGLLVFWPRALAGARLIEREGLGRAILVGVGWGIPAWVVASLLAALVSDLLSRAGIRAQPEVAQQVLSTANPFVAVLATVIIAPVAEEVFFRGVALNAWTREYGARRAIIGSALLFGLIHGSLIAILPIFGLGLALALVYRRTANLASAIALHATFNGISVALALLVRYDIIRLPT